MRTLLLIAVVALLSVACERGPRKDINGRPFTGPDYAVDVPGDWVTNRGFMNTDFAAMIPDSEADDGFTENLNVVIECLPPGMTTSGYVAATRAQLVKQLSARVISEETITLGGESGLRIRYEMPNRETSFDNDVLLVTKGSGAYVITLTMLKGASRERHHAELLAAAMTFRFK